MSTTNGGPEAPAMDVQPQLNVVGQYIKDFSFENPNAPRSMMPTGQQPQIGVQIKVDAAPLSDTDVEVSLKLEGKAEMNGTIMFAFDLTFAGVFRIRNVPQESMNALVLIECPRLLFPFARETIASTVRQGGFPPLLLDPIDFMTLYRAQLAQQRAGGPQAATTA